MLVSKRFGYSAPDDLINCGSVVVCDQSSMKWNLFASTSDAKEQIKCKQENGCAKKTIPWVVWAPFAHFTWMMTSMLWRVALLYLWRRINLVSNVANIALLNIAKCYKTLENSRANFVGSIDNFLRIGLQRRIISAGNHRARFQKINSRQRARRLRNFCVWQSNKRAGTLLKPGIVTSNSTAAAFMVLKMDRREYGVQDGRKQGEESAYKTLRQCSCISRHSGVTCDAIALHRRLCVVVKIIFNNCKEGGRKGW
jgi:hypothetical protein